MNPAQNSPKENSGASGGGASSFVQFPLEKGSRKVYDYSTMINKKTEKLITIAKSLEGQPYKYGAKPSEAPRYFDCSGIYSIHSG